MDNPTTETTTQKVAYWPNVLWCSPNTAALAVDLGEFSDNYQLAEFPHNLPPEQISGFLRPKY